MDKQFKNKLFVCKYKRIIRATLFGLYAAVALGIDSTIAAPKGKLEDWRFSPQASQLEISLSSPSRPKYFYLSQPPRIVVDLPDTQMGYVPTTQDYTGAVERIRVSQLNESVTRIVMDLAPGILFDRDRVQLQPVTLQNLTRWVFRPLIATNGYLSEPRYPSFTNELPPPNYSPSPNSSIYNPQLPGNIPYQQLPGNIPSPINNNPLLPAPGINTLPSMPMPSTLPNAINNSNQPQPSVTVPPITRSNLSPLMPNTELPPARFSSPLGNPNSAPSLFPNSQPNFPAINSPSNLVNPPNSGAIEFGQPIPNR